MIACKLNKLLHTSGTFPLLGI